MKYSERPEVDLIVKLQFGLKRSRAKRWFFTATNDWPFSEVGFLRRAIKNDVELIKIGFRLFRWLMEVKWPSWVFVRIKRNMHDDSNDTIFETSFIHWEPLVHINKI